MTMIFFLSSKQLSIFYLINQIEYLEGECEREKNFSKTLAFQIFFSK